MVCFVVHDRGLQTSADSTDCLCISGVVRLLLHGDPLASADCFPVPWQPPPERIFGGTSNLALNRGLMFLNADGVDQVRHRLISRGRAICRGLSAALPPLA